MPLLFSYGTLQLEDVQRATFGRLLQGTRDELPGFAPSQVPIADRAAVAASGKTHHDDATFTGRDDTRVPGTAFGVTDAELTAADQYEQRADYVRVEVRLASGRRAWVYVHSGSVPPQLSSLNDLRPS